MKFSMETAAKKLFGGEKVTYIESVILTILFWFMIKGLCDYDTALYQTYKYLQADIFVLAFSLIVFIIRKVRLLNWQSLAATIAFIPIAVWQIGIWNESPDIQNILKVEVWAEWVVLMILIDILLYKKLQFPNKNNYVLFVLYGLMSVAMLFHRNGRNDPLYLFLPLMLFVFTEIGKDEWERLFRALINGFFFFFVYAVIKSFLTVPFNPRQHLRYYGYFTNIGAFGMFLACVFVCILVALLYSKEKYGRKSFFYITSWVWMISCLYMIWLTNTMTLFAGIGLSLFFLFIFGGKNTDRKVIVKRLLIVIGILAALVLFCYVIYRTYGHYNEWVLYKKGRKSGIWAPYYAFAHRIVRVVNRTDRSSLKSFLFTLLDTFSSYRLTIIKAYSEYFSFTGNTPIPYIYLENIDYYAVSAHNNYIQVIVDYGYVAAAVYFVFVGTALFTAVKRFLNRGKKSVDLLPVLWIPMCLGLWMGEACGFVYPATFVMLILICRMISEK